jgi:hypothetical protein
MNLQLNPFGNKGAAALAAALRVNKSLTSIDLGGCSIGDTGALKLAAALTVNQTLKSLHMYIGGEGEMKRKGCEALADALQANATLTSICLTNRYYDTNTANGAAIHAARCSCIAAVERNVRFRKLHFVDTRNALLNVMTGVLVDIVFAYAFNNVVERGSFCMLPLRVVSDTIVDVDNADVAALRAQLAVVVDERRRRCDVAAAAAAAAVDERARRAAAAAASPKKKKRKKRSW